MSVGGWCSTSGKQRAHLHPQLTEAQRLMQNPKPRILRYHADTVAVPQVDR